MNELTKLVTFLKNQWELIKAHTFSVIVDNQIEFPEIPEVKMPDYPTEISISNLEDIKQIDKFDDIVKAIENQNKELKPQDKKIVGELKTIQKELKKEKKDLTPKVIKGISELIKSVDSKSIDFSALETGVQDLYNLIESVREYDELKVKLNGKQFERLSKKTAQAIAAGGATGKYDKDILEAVENVDGVIGTNLEGEVDLTVGTTAVEITFTGETKAITISSDSLNTGFIYIGKSDVQSDGTNAIKKIYAGEELTIDYNDATNALYIISDTAAQLYGKVALL